jgi:KRAB domain-containing zinc finger protein
MKFECNVCLKRFTRKDNLKRHTRSVHSDVQFSCDICHTTFNRKDAYVKHERSCSLICEYCDTELDCGSDLSIHVKSQHTDKQYMCSKCGKKYVDKRDLKKHQQNCSQTVSSFTLRWIINRIRNGVKGLRHYNFYYINFTGWFT